MKKNVVVRMNADIEARPIANMVQIANRYSSKVYLEMGSKRVNAKSIMGMMSLALMNGEEVVLDIVGEDEEEAMIALEQFLSK